MQALVESTRRKQSVLVAGLDPYPDRLPAEVRGLGLPEDRAAYEFCRGILEAVEPEVAAVKLQAAYFERMGPAGMEVYAALIKDATALGLPVIADVKRGDIGPVAAAYAEAPPTGLRGHMCNGQPLHGLRRGAPFPRNHPESSKRRRRIRPRIYLEPFRGFFTGIYRSAALTRWRPGW